ncbi:MAG: phenylacetic acid degradation protein PaaN [Rhodocyclaceae bacterium]|nr:phenylacetic acid degradation protein PaaN [Rhodocyclaceae bacterium]
MSHPLFDKHLAVFRQAMAAVENRVYWSPFAETPASLGEAAADSAREAFEAYRDASFYLDQPGVQARGGSEISPYGLSLNISYPICNPDALILAARAGMTPWVKSGPEARAGVCLEILFRLKQYGLEIAHAAMHTTGQSLAFAFQHSVAHALDRGLEAVACAYREMKQVPGRATWEKPQGGGKPSLRLDKTYTVVPRGVALVVSNAVSPTWNAFPAIFASLSTGNPVIVKPHHTAILPLAISVAAARMVLKEEGFDPGLISLLVDDDTDTVARIAALRPEIRLIDFTGSGEMGHWLGENAHQAVVFVQRPGLNCVVVDSTEDYKGLLRNLAVSISLYSGQLAATPRLILVSREGVRTPDGTVASEQFIRDLAFAIGRLLEDPARAVEILGCVQSPQAVERIGALREECDVVRDSAPVVHPQWPLARIHTPLLLRMASSDDLAWAADPAVPVAGLLETATTTESLALAERIMGEHGALAFAVHSSNEHVLEMADDAALRSGVALSLNLTGGALMNQPAAYADFLGTGANPAASCSFTDAAFVTPRFSIAQTQRPSPP